MTATTQMTQTGEDDMPEYISIYDNKPKRKWEDQYQNKPTTTKSTYEKNSINTLL